MLFSRSEMHRRKPNRAAVKPKPKQDDLFPEVREILAYDGGPVAQTDDGVLVIRRSAKLPTQNQPTAKPEAPIAA